MSTTTAAAGSLNRPLGLGSGKSPLALLPSGEQFTAAPASDNALAAAQQLRAAAMTRAGNPLSQVPTSLIPMGGSNYHAVAKISIFTKDLGAATIQRSDSQVDVHTTQGDATITVDSQNPSLVDVAVPGSSTKYQGTLTQNGGGVIARTTDGKTVTVTPDSNGMVIQASGFPQVPSSAQVILTRA